MRALAVPRPGGQKAVPCTPRTPRVVASAPDSDSDEDEDADYLVMDLLQHLPPEKAERLMRGLRAKDRRLQALRLENRRLQQQLASQSAEALTAAASGSECEDLDELGELPALGGAAVSPGPAPPAALPQQLSEPERRVLEAFAPLRWWPLGIAAVYADRGQSVLYAWSNTIQSWECMSWKGVAWFDTLELATALQLRDRTGSPGLIQSLRGARPSTAAPEELAQASAQKGVDIALWKFPGGARED